jgi:hypothetical protein
MKNEQNVKMLKIDVFNFEDNLFDDKSIIVECILKLDNELSRDKTTGTFERVKVEADHHTSLKMRPHHVISRLAHLAFLQFVRLDR